MGSAHDRLLETTLRDLRDAARPPDPAKLVDRLQIASMQELAAQGDSLERPFAERVLARAAVSLGFQEPRRFLELKKPAFAIASLKAVKVISPWSPLQCSYLEQARSMLPEAERATSPVCAH